LVPSGGHRGSRGFGTALVAGAVLAASFFVAPSFFGAGVVLLRAWLFVDRLLMAGSCCPEEVSRAFEH
jgi:hypothetical protein